MGMPNESAEKSLRFHLSSIVDPRMNRTQEHSLVDILMISVCAILCGAEGFADCERFGNGKREWLSTFLELPNGIPSHDTFGRVFGKRPPKHTVHFSGRRMAGVGSFKIRPAPIWRRRRILDRRSLPGTLPGHGR
jgi:hypothetical protein